MRRSVSVGAFAVLAALSLHASADTGLPMYPKAGCQAYTDAAGDALLVGAPGEPNAPSFDITGVSFRTTPYSYNVVLRVPQLDGLGGSRGTGDTWRVDFTSGKHLVELKVSRFSPVPPVSGRVPVGPRREVDVDVNQAYERRTPGTSLNEVIVDDFAVVGVHPGGDFDNVRGYVTISIDRSTLDDILGAPVTTVKGVDVISATRVVVDGTPQLVGEFSILTVDDAAAPAKQEIDVTENACYV